MSDLLASVTTLNSLRDETTRVILVMEANLQRISPDVEAWYGNYGYARVKGKWRLACRTDPPYGPVVELTSSSTSDRIEGIRCYSGIIDVLTEECDRLAAKIRDLMNEPDGVVAGIHEIARIEAEKEKPV